MEPEKMGYTLLKYEEPGMGTLFQIQVWSQTPERDAQVIKQALAVMADTEKTMSEWLPDSEISQLNHQAGKNALAISHELYHVLKTGKQISKRSGGAFAMTWAALRGVWDFSTPLIPDPKLIRSRLPFIGDQKIELRQWAFTPGSPRARLKQKGMLLGLGGIAKGYALDQAMLILREGGVKNALVFAGGDIRTITEADFKPWRIAIEHPRQTSPLGILEINQGAVATSGDYEKYFIKNGQRYHHLIDPRTGFPANHNSSVTVLTDAGIKADAWATALFIMTPDEAIHIIENDPNMEAIIVSANGELFISNGIEEKFHLQQ
jgi:thiamine biosynthesis lipoprotein